MLRTLGLFLAVMFIGTACFATSITLQNNRIVLDVDSDAGVFDRITYKPSNINLEPPASLADNFKLVLLNADKTTTTILGKDQELSDHKQIGSKLSLFWKGPLTDTANAPHNISVRMDITLSKSLEFRLHVENRTDSKLQEAWYPLVGGLTDFAPDASAWYPLSTPIEKPVKLPLENTALQYPAQMIMSFCCISSKTLGKSIYFASQDETARYKVYHLMEVDDKDNKDVFTSIHHSPFTPPGKDFDGSPVALDFVDGDWRAAGQVYRKWFIDKFGIAPLSKDWIRRQSFFLMTMFMMPEGTIELTFKDIPKWAKAAKQCGINAVQVSGWQMGGHDNGYPYYVPDPRLGTWKDLEDGIRACHKMGMKVYFFANYQPMMVDSNWYKNELHKYREMNADGSPTWMAGWGMGTLSARMGHPKLMTWADLSFPQFRKIIVSQFAKLASIGADGVHVDKMFPTGLSFNPDSPMSPDTCTWEGAILLSKELMTECRKRNPNWDMSFECNWDRMLQFGCATWWVGNQLITRKIFPENVETLGLYQAYDYLGVNTAVRNGHAVMVAPLNFSRGVDWPPFVELAKYIKEVKRIRDSLQETVFYGEVLGKTDVEFGGALPAGVDYNVFKNRRTSRRVCVLTNNSRERRQVDITFTGKTSAKVRIQAPYQKPRVIALPATVHIPGERIVFVDELGATTGDMPPVHSVHPVHPVHTSLSNGDFETGNFAGWTPDPNWVVANDSRVYYSGWQGKYWAWSGGTGEAATGKLRSRLFVMDKQAVKMMISGWDSIFGTGNPRKWNYVTLNLENGQEIDRVYAPNTTTFVPAFLDGSKYRGRTVYVEAVDDADQPSFAMLCIDDVRTVDMPTGYSQPAPSLPAFDPTKYIRLENATCLVEVKRANGSISRIHDKRAGLDLILEPKLGGSYRFALMIPGGEPWQTIEANWIFGKQNKLSSYFANDNKLILRWDGPLKNYLGAKFAASVSETIQLIDGGVLFSMSIDNKSKYPVGEVYFPIIGGIQGLGKTLGQLKSTEMVRPAANDSFATANIFYVFNNAFAFGDQGPEQAYSYPDAQPEPWVGFSCAKAGRAVYIGAEDPTNRKQVIRMEMFPASSGTPRDDGNWPRPEELKGIPCGVELSFVDIANFPGHQIYHAAPVFLKFVGSDKAEMGKVHEQRKTTN